VAGLAQYRPGGFTVPTQPATHRAQGEGMAKTRSFAVGWRQVGVCFMLMAATAMIATTYSFIALPLIREFKLSQGTALLAMTVLSGTGAVLTPLLGNLMDRVSVRRMMVLGGLALAAGYAAISLATSFIQVLVIFALLVAPANVLLGPVAATVLLSRWFADRRGLAMGIAIAGISAGTFMFPRIVQTMLDTWEWREALQLFSLLLLVWTVPAALMAVDRPADRGLYPDGADEPSATVKAEIARDPVTVWEVISNPAFWMLALTVAIVTSGMKGMITNLARIGLNAGIEPAEAATFASVYAACGFISKLNFAALADRIGARVLMFASLGGVALGMACLAQTGSGYWTIAIGIGIVGMFGGLMVPIESYLAPRIFGQRAVGKAMGLLAGTILLTLLISPPLFGYIFDLTGSFAGMFWTYCGMALVALLWVPWIRLTAREATKT
jgi:MFS family permease